eukprot:1537193-Pyramimonas_sp.AAC.1
MSSSCLDIVAPVSTRCHQSSRSTRCTRSCCSGLVRHEASSVSTMSTSPKMLNWLATNVGCCCCLPLL